MNSQHNKSISNLQILTKAMCNTLRSSIDKTVILKGKIIYIVRRAISVNLHRWEIQKAGKYFLKKLVKYILNRNMST